jgi:hypothetical protein
MTAESDWLSEPSADSPALDLQKALLGRCYNPYPSASDYDLHLQGSHQNQDQFVLAE